MMEQTFDFVLPEKEGTEIPKKRILFVCTGNTCRSPMCAALYNDRFAGLTAHADSAGLYADGSPITPEAAEALKKTGVRPTADNDYPNHISRTVSEADMEQADRVVGMTSSHVFQLVLRFPQYASKITRLPLEITDPYGGDGEDYAECLERIEKALQQLTDENEL